jgi:hypothetical protein
VTANWRQAIRTMDEWKAEFQRRSWHPLRSVPDGASGSSGKMSNAFPMIGPFGKWYSWPDTVGCIISGKLKAQKFFCLSRQACQLSFGFLFFYYLFIDLFFSFSLVYSHHQLLPE